MEAEQLTVAYPTVQHAVHMDVVGLEEKAEMNSKSLDKQAKAAVLLPGQIFYDVRLILFVLSSEPETAACVSSATFHCAF